MPRPKKTPNTADMLEVARLYYVKDIAKQKIARRFGIDGRTVNRLLDEARKRRLVRIDILAMDESGLGAKLKAKHKHLHDVFLVESGPVKTALQYDEILRKLALVAADVFNDAWERHPSNKALHVGVSGGETLLAFANAVPELERKNVYVHSLAIVGHGRLQNSAVHILPLVNASTLWLRNGRIPAMLEYATIEPFPLMEPGPEARAKAETELDRIEKHKSIREVVQDMNHVDIAFAGLGVVKPPKDATAAMKSRLTIMGLLQSIVTADQLESEGAVADLAYNIMDATGRTKEKWRFFITAGHYSEHPGIRFFQDMVNTPGKKVVVIAGPHKVEAIKAGLAAKAFNVLISDSHSVSQIA